MLSVSGPQLPVFAWPRHRAVLAVFVHRAFSFSLASSRLSTLMPRPSYRTPLPSLFLLLLVTRPPARLPHRVDLPLFSPLFSPVIRTGSAPCPRPYLHSMHRLCIPFPPHPLPVCCTPTPFVYIRYHWSLLFFCIPIPLTFTAELQNLVVVVKLGSAV